MLSIKLIIVIFMYLVDIFTINSKRKVDKKKILKSTSNYYLPNVVQEK
jgi:hypothetical protein